MLDNERAFVEEFISPKMDFSDADNDIYPT